MDTGIVPSAPNNTSELRSQQGAQLAEWIKRAIRRDDLPPELEGWLQREIADWVKSGAG